MTDEDAAAVPADALGVGDEVEVLETRDPSDGPPR